MKIRWAYRCVLYFIISMVISPYYDGWSSTTKYLISEGVFSKSCCKSPECSKLLHLKPVCDSQAYSVGRLLSFYRISEFISSIFIGVFMDNVGPKITVVLSIILRMLSWLLVPLAPNNFPVIIFSCILCGITSNGLAFPVFTIAQYTKRRYNLSMILISVSLCFGTFFTFVLNYVKHWLRFLNPLNIILIMLTVTHLPLLILSAFIFPNSLEKDVILNSPPTTAIGSSFSRRNSLSNSLRSSRKNSLNENTSTNNTTTITGNDANLANYRDEDVIIIGDNLDLKGEKWEFKTFLNILKRVDIMVISLSAMVNVLSLTFAQESFPISYGNNKPAILVNEILLPLSFIFSVASVYFLDKFGSVPIIIFMNSMGILLHLSMAFINTTLSVFTSILMSLGYSLFMTQYYLYLDKQVPLLYQGSIKGFLAGSIGFVLFISIGLNYLSKTYFYNREIHITLLILRGLVLLPLIKFLKCKRSN